MSVFRRSAYRIAIGMLTESGAWSRLVDEAETWDSEQVNLYQREALTGILRLASENGFYVQHWGSNAAGTMEDLTGVPVLQRAHVRKLFEVTLASADKRCRIFSTGGTGGQPIQVLQNTRYVDAARAVSLKFDRWCGYVPGNRRVLLWGSMKDVGLAKAGIRNRLFNWMKNDRWVDGFRITQGTVERLRRELSRGAALLLGYSSSLEAVARLSERMAISFKPPGCVMASAGSLTEPMRSLLRDRFGARVVNRYGSRECGDMACTCVMNRMHFCPVTNIVEVVDMAGRPVDGSSTGRLLITSLVNSAMPLIRYEIGDVAGGLQIQKCECGLAWPWVSNIEGRSADALLGTDGAYVAPHYFIHVLGVELFSANILKYQVVQMPHRDVVVHYVPVVRDFEIGAEREQSIRTCFQAVLGDDVSVTFVPRDDIPPLASGKYQYVRREQMQTQ